MFKFNQISKGLSLLCFLLLLGLTACNSDEDSNQLIETNTVENFVDASIADMQDRVGCGKMGCFDLVFPVSVSFPDGTITEVADYSELHATIKAWKEDNADAKERPSLVFPIEVLNEDGELVSIANEEELRELRATCPRSPRGKGHKGDGNGRGLHCFDLVFPVSIQFPDATTQEVNDKREAKQALRDWKEANPDSEERPELVFPIEVTLEADDSTMTINSIEELQALKESCRG